jgi:hypothetical protein
VHKAEAFESGGKIFEVEWNRTDDGGEGVAFAATVKPNHAQAHDENRALDLMVKESVKGPMAVSVTQTCEFGLHGEAREDAFFEAAEGVAGCV